MKTNSFLRVAVQFSPSQKCWKGPVFEGPFWAALRRHLPVHSLVQGALFCTLLLCTQTIDNNSFSVVVYFFWASHNFLDQYATGTPCCIMQAPI